MRDEAAFAAPMLMPIEAARRAELERSVAAFGFAPFIDALTPAALSTLRAEARAAHNASVLAERAPDGEARPEGAARSYRANLTCVGPVARDFLTGQPVLALLRDYFGGEHALSEDFSCLTFYDASGHLGAHLDQPADDCAVTIIICLDAESPDPAAPDTGLVLAVYGEEAASVGVPRLRIPTRAGTVVLGRGSRVWHERPRLKEGESVIAITGCYRQLR